jgi:20S proteasome alpha/beta subunit
MIDLARIALVGCIWLIRSNQSRKESQVSLCVAVVIPEGIVFAGESRQTQIIAGVNRVATDSGIKVFDLTDTILAATSGWVFLRPQGATMARNISSIVEDFKATIPASSTVETVARSLWSYFNDIYQHHIVQVPADTLAAGNVASD